MSCLAAHRVCAIILAAHEAKLIQLNEKVNVSKHDEEAYASWNGKSKLLDVHHSSGDVAVYSLRNHLIDKQ
jgi:hypothetical protein